MAAASPGVNAPPVMASTDFGEGVGKVGGARHFRQVQRRGPIPGGRNNALDHQLTRPLLAGLSGLDHFLDDRRPP